MKKFNIEVTVQDWLFKKTFIGTNEAAHNNADDWRITLVQDYIQSNMITDIQEQEKIVDSSTYTITYDNDSLGMYAVYRTGGRLDPIIGVYYTLDKAQEMAGKEYFIQPVEVFGVQEVEE